MIYPERTNRDHCVLNFSYGLLIKVEIPRLPAASCSNVGNLHYKVYVLTHLNDIIRTKLDNRPSVGHIQWVPIVKYPEAEQSYGYTKTPHKTREHPPFRGGVR